jgi:hypothetical protein
MALSRAAGWPWPLLLRYRREAERVVAALRVGGSGSGRGRGALLVPWCGVAVVWCMVWGFLGSRA